ncbi:hypothetical protein PTTG_26377 [Puccinia triticina 1-1 BBBD Race 1]|uniref:Uncharacterized protein n=1 Tax=Puccinia triticina (isolate 1-1 / race 1 (BBBD)) TaxID=630390 RepID=A0A180GUB0_PUCT1|nr:hypothetical protein PTTG_26377 [Puccinia triticina 1-1 BBBD Race 1]
MAPSNRTLKTTSHETLLADRVNFRGHVYVDQHISTQADGAPLGQGTTFRSWLSPRPPANRYFFPINLQRAFIDGAIPLVGRVYNMKGFIDGISQDGALELKFTSSMTSQRPFRRAAAHEPPLTVNAVGTICALSMINILSKQPVCAITLEHTTVNDMPKLLIDFIIPLGADWSFDLDSNHIGLRAWFYGDLAGVNVENGRTVVVIHSGRVFGVEH